MTAGDSVTWTEVLPEYPALTNTISIVLIAAGVDSKKSFTAAGTGFSHTFSLSSAQTGELAAGRYDYQLLATGDGFRTTLDRGDIEVLADLSTLTSHDGRDWLDTAIAALEASIAGRASRVQMERSFDGVTIREMTQLEQLETLERLKGMRAMKKGRWKKTITSRFRN